MRTMIRAAVMTAALCTGVTAVASAQTASMSRTMSDGQIWYVSPFAGSPFGDDLHHTGSAVGISGGWKGKGWLGLEGEYADSPNSFEQNGFLISRRVTTFMGNAIVTLPGGNRLRPYAVGGAGLLRPRLTEAGGLATVEGNRWGFNAGGGATVAVLDHIGVRGDLRYFHGLNQTPADTNAFDLDVSKFGFWRASVGLVVGF